jgi:hypothetical protein
LTRMLITLAVLAGLAVTAGPAASATGAAECRPALAGLSLSPASVPGGASAQAKVTLSCAGPSRITLGMTGFAGATVPKSVRVPAHRSNISVTIRTSVRTALTHGTITVTLGRASRRAQLTITRTPPSCPAPKLTGFTLARLVYVGNHPAAVIQLSCAPKRPARLSLTSTSSFLPVPAVITIGRYYNSATVALTPKADEAGPYTATVRVRYGSRSLSRTLTVNPGLAVFSNPPSSEPNSVGPEVLFTGIIPAGGYTVHFSSSNPAVVKLPATASFQAGSLGGGILGTAQEVSKNTKVTLTASFGGITLHTSVLLIPPFGPGDSITLANEQSSGPIYGQEFTLEYIATLSNPAGPAGLTVTFSSGDPSLELQSTSDDVTPGFAQAFVDINTANVTSPVHTELTATADGVTTKLPITIEPGLASITMPATVTGGDPFTGTVSLAGPVDTPTTIALQSTWGIVTVPGLVTIPSGQSSVNFTATTVPVSTDSDVSIVAMLGNTTLQSGNITLTP